jgi:putative ABC transport system permease protein
MKLSVRVLSVKNLKAKPVRTVCLGLVTAVLGFTLFGGSLLALNLRQGLTVMTKRFGADLLVVPEGSGERAQSLLLRGGAGYFYFDAGVVDAIAKTEGVVCASPQFFLTSLAEECCDAMVQLIGYDPETDFVIQPWVAEKYRDQVRDGQVVIGGRINPRSNNTIQLFNREYPVNARLSNSASGLDTSIFMTMNTMRDLIGRARAEGYNFLAVQEKETMRGRVSAVLVKTDAGKSQSIIAQDIRKQNAGVEVLASQGIFARITSALSGLIKYLRVFTAALWTAAFVVLTAVFSGTIHERKKEFALLRILGATRKKIIGLVLSESVLTAIAGGFAGIALACLAAFPFSVYIGERLELPYLDAPVFSVVAMGVGSLSISVLTAALASLYSALRISGAETYFTLREGE